jgi:hypothetical protein
VDWSPSDFLVAVEGGAAAAALIYIFGRVFFRPSLRYSNGIRRSTRDGITLYQFKIYNASFCRAITNVEIAATIRLFRFETPGRWGPEPNYLRVPVRTTVPTVVRIEPRGTRVIALVEALPSPVSKQVLNELGQSDLLRCGSIDLDRWLSLVTLRQGAGSKPDSVLPASNFDTRPVLSLVANCRAAFTGRDFSFSFLPMRKDDIHDVRFGEQTRWPGHILTTVITKNVRRGRDFLERRYQVPFKL